MHLYPGRKLRGNSHGTTRFRRRKRPPKTSDKAWRVTTPDGPPYGTRFQKDDSGTSIHAGPRTCSHHPQALCNAAYDIFFPSLSLLLFLSIIKQANRFVKQKCTRHTHSCQQTAKE